MTDPSSLPEATDTEPPAWLRGLIARRGEPDRYFADDGLREWSWEDSRFGVGISPSIRGWTTVRAWSPRRVAYLDVLGKPEPADISWAVAGAGLDDRPEAAPLSRLPHLTRHLKEQPMTDTTTPLPPEPDDRTALYWPETVDAGSRLLIRDDAAAEALRKLEHPDLPPNATWFVPNTDPEDPPGTWAEVVATFDEDWHLGNVIRLVADPSSAA